MREAGYIGKLCHCGSVFIDPLPLADSINPELDLHMETYYSLPAKIRIDWVEEHTSGTRLLDVGAGNGATVSEALSREFEVEAIEPNARCANALRGRFGILVQNTSLELSALPDEGYDAVFHIDLLSHFNDPVSALKKMSSMLKPESGVLCFEVGLFGGMNKHWYRFAGRPGFPQHRWFFSLDNIESLLRQADLVLVDSRQFNVAPSTILSSLLRALTPSNLRAVPDAQSLEAAEPNRIWRTYHLIHHFLRYHLGSVLPQFGPSTALIVAAPEKKELITNIE